MNEASAIPTDVFLRCLTLSWQGAVLVIVIISTRAIFRDQLRPRLRYALWSLVAIRLLLPVDVSSPFSAYNLFPDHSAVTYEFLPPLERPQSAISGTNQLPSADASELTRGSIPTKHVPASLDWLLIAAVVWALGSGGFLSYFIAHRRFLNRELAGAVPVIDARVQNMLRRCAERVGVKRHIALLSSHQIDSPVLVGAFRPRLLVPEHFFERANEEHARHVLLHELVHVRRRDLAAGLLADMLVSVHWFNPLLWWARRELLFDRELACDDDVLQLLESTERAAYGHTLLNELQYALSAESRPGLVGIADGRGSKRRNIHRRITMIERFRNPTTLRRLVAGGSLLVLALAFLTHAVSQETDNTIRPGVGLDEIQLGSTWDDVLDAWGLPDHSQQERFLGYYQSRGVDIVFDDGRVTEIRFGRGFAGATAEGVRPGDPLVEMLEATGAGDIVQVDGDRISMAPNAEWGITVEAGGFSLSRPEGIAYWISPDREVGQITVFPTGTEPTETITVFDRGEFSNVLQRIGHYLLTFAEASEGHRYPDLSSVPGELTVAIGPGEGHRLVEPYLPAEDEEAWRLLENDEEVIYLGYAVQTDEDIERFADAYRHAVESGQNFSDNLPYATTPAAEAHPDKLYHFRIGIERFYITDINDPASPARARSKLPVLIQWPTDVGRVTGGYVLFLDGHVEFMKYPGRWPMTETTIGILKELADKE